LCECDCGNLTLVRPDMLKSGNTQSCGCLSEEALKMPRPRHGLSHTKVHRAWTSIRMRCENTSSPKYENYGGRGIRVCDSWHSFENFLADMGQPPSASHSIDRINNDGDYAPDNCHWATHKEQSRNKTTSHNITFNGKTQCIRSWEDDIGMVAGTLAARIRRGWSVEDAITRPVRKIHK